MSNRRTRVSRCKEIFIQTKYVKMMAIDGSNTERLLTKCSHLKARDYRNHPSHSIDELDELISILKTGNRAPSQSLLKIIQTLISSIDRKTLWKIKSKKNEQQVLAQLACRLYKYLCQFDPKCAASEQGILIVHSVLQWLRDDTDFYLIKSGNQDLHVEIYSVLEQYSLLCTNREEFLQELFFITPSKEKSSSTFIKSCFSFHSRHSTSPPESLSIITYTTRLLIYLLQSSLVTCSLLINQILTFFLLFAPIKRFAVYLVHQTDLYTSNMIPLFSTKNSDYFVQCILNETAQAQIDDNDRVYIFTHLINLLSEFVLHQGIEIHSCPFVPMFKQLFDALVECGTTVPLWYLLKCFSNLLTSNSLETDLLLDEMNRLNLISSIMHYTATLINKSNLGQGQMVLTELHQKVLISSLIILYNISSDDNNEPILDRDLILQQICRPLFHSNIEHLRLIACLLYSNLLTEQEMQLDQSSHQLSDELIGAIRQAFQSENYEYFNEIPLLSLVSCLKKLCTHREFQKRLGRIDENIDLLFQIIRRFHTSWEQQEEIEVILQSIWFLSFETSSALKIHRHDKYFALLVQLAETNPNERIQQAAKGILWQLRQTISTPPPTPEPQLPNSSQHIMFSYNHDSKELVQRICQALQHAGYRTWIDVDDMHGSTLECMAHAVEQSKVILICMSEKYKRSPNCQSEAEYAHRLGKPFIPILLQAKYKPDGWLGMLLGTRLYVDFTKNEFQWNIRKLVKEIEVIQH